MCSYIENNRPEGFAKMGADGTVKHIIETVAF